MNTRRIFAWVVIHSLALGQSAWAEDPARMSPPRLIVRGDDMGYSHAGNEALLKCFKEGIETSIEIIVPSPWFPEAVKMLTENPKVDVGVHLTLTSEWDHVKWRPLSECPSLRDEDGYFYPMISPNKNYPKRSLQENRWRIEDVEKEFRAQIEMALRKIPRVSHLSGHMGCDSIREDVRILVNKLAKEYKLDIAPADFGVRGIGYSGPRATSEQKIASFLKTIESLEAGKTYLFVDHPGLDTPELRAIHHIGYENVAIDRQGVTDTWTNPGVRKLIESKGIRLIGYRDLKTDPAAKSIAKFEKEIRAFEAADKKVTPPKKAILFLGSSTIRLWKTLDQDFPKHKIINRGFGGSQIEDCTELAERIVYPYEPSMIFFRAGGNDLNSGKTPEHVFEDFKSFVRKVHSKLPETEIVFLSLCPSIARAEQAEQTRALNALIEDYVRKSSRMKYVELYDLSLTTDGHLRPELFAKDKLHLNAEGYKILAERVRPHLPAPSSAGP